LTRPTAFAALAANKSASSGPAARWAGNAPGTGSGTADGTGVRLGEPHRAVGAGGDPVRTRLGGARPMDGHLTGGSDPTDPVVASGDRAHRRAGREHHRPESGGSSWCSVGSPAASSRPT